MGDTSVALSDFSKAIEINPDDVSYYNRGNCYNRLGDYEKAILDFNISIELNPLAMYYHSRANSKYQL